MTFRCLVLILAASVSAEAQSTLPLVQPADLVYAGAFRFPSWQSDANSFNYGGTALAFNVARGSLFAIGHPSYQRAVEISIPAVRKNSTLAQLDQARVLQPYADVLAGKRTTIDGGIADGVRIGGLLPFNGTLIVSAFAYYDAGGGQTKSHFKTAQTFASLGTVLGPVVLANGQAGFVSGYMAAIPQAWQAALGGVALTGNCCIPVISRTSFGPSVTVFNPADVGVISPIPAVRLLGYNAAHPTLGSYSTPGEWFNGAVAITGLVFPEGTRSLLFFGNKPTNKANYCYGQGTTDPALHRQPNPAAGPSEIWCYDPSSPYKGTHGYPYTFAVWAYDANDLAAVKAGIKEWWQPVPYASWHFSTPYQLDTGYNAGRYLMGAAYDPSTQRIFLSMGNHDGCCAPVMHVFQVTASITTKTVTVSGCKAASKTYDGTVSATLDMSGCAASGVVQGDAVALSCSSSTGAFATKQAGAGKAVQIAGCSLTGADASNYALVQPTILADITKKPLTISGLVALDRPYDGTVNVVIDTAGAVLAGKIAGDDVSVDLQTLSATFADKHVGANKVVTITVTIGGADAANYQVQ